MRLIVAFIVACLVLAPITRAADIPQRPNVVFILMDDMRWDCMSIAGHPFIKTPNLDRIGLEGAYFKNAMVTYPLCSPARADFFTGTYAHHHGIVGNAVKYGEISHQLDTYHRHLQSSGYQTAAIGKWHMGVDDSPRPGFDYWAVFKGQGRYIDCPFNINGTQTKTAGYVTDIITDYAVNFIKSDHGGKPFSLYIGEKAVHGNFTPAERHKDLFRDEKLPQAPSVNDDLVGKKAIRRDVQMEKEHPAYGVSDELMRNQLRCILAVDDGVGKIFKALEETNQLDNTFIVFTSDNGYFWNEHKLGDKRAAYEEALRIPMLARYPKLIKPGTQIDQMVLDIDFAPTFCELAQSSSKPAIFHGRSMLPLFSGDFNGQPWRTSALFEYFMEPAYANVPTWHAVRTDRWKYIYYDDVADVDELYDLKNDPYEMKNVIADPANAEQVAAMKAEMKTMLEQTK
jgi:N-acetylglucosamine-6-sulfatase